MSSRRALLGGVVLLLTLQFLFWVYAAGVWWAFRTGLFELDTPAVIAENTRTAVVITVTLALNLAAAIVFLIRRRGFGWWVLAAVQVIDVGVTTVIGLRFAAKSDLTTAEEWWAATAVAALTLILVMGLRPKQSPA
jgi:hypothetical protein